jgi:beta-galactosidase
VQTRRKFLQVLSGSGAVLFGAAGFSEPEQAAPAAVDYESFILTDGWLLRLDPAASAQPPDEGVRTTDWLPVSVPHTWQSLGGSPDYSGVAWYKLQFLAPVEWSSRHVRVEFEAVTHTAHVFLNGKAIGEHVGKGYTAFTFDLSPYLNPGQQNTLLVRVENRPNDRMLPRNKSYDWTDDGGIIRPVHLHITPPTFIESSEIDAKPDLNKGTAEIRVRVKVRNAGSTPQQGQVHVSVRRDGTPDEIAHLTSVSSTVQANSEAWIEIGPTSLSNPSLWHFDSPNLYSAVIELKSALGSHQTVESFGIRQFEIRGTAFYLNGEKVSLFGVERMAGSRPEFGMAETKEWIESNHRDMKNLNCVFTRVHWAQDRRVLDFCDRHGILMQEEVPAWGPDTFRETSNETQRALEENGLDQLREMIARDRNHPCIVAWGLCNEVDGKNPRARQFALLLSAEARRLDPSRLQTYASHSLGSDPAADMAGNFDFVSTNEYYGSWTPGGPQDVEAHIERIRKAFPDKPIVVSEYGWCECQPKILPGDNNRVEIINSHTEVFRRFPEVAGAIYFDYNDYRTLVGDKGTGAMQQRVHGVVDLFGKPKPSFEALRVQASPVEQANLRRFDQYRFELEIRTRKQLPGYSLRGYSLRWVAFGYDDLPMNGHVTALPILPPGMSHTFEARLDQNEIRRVVVDLMRPTGFSVLTVEYLEQAASK